MALIEVSNLEKIYQDEDTATPALQGVSFSIAAGEFVAIMGPSGSGKSTLLHILGFLDTPTGGEYRFEGKRADEYSERESAEIRNKRMGFIFQSFNLLARTSVLENVELPLVYAGAHERARRLAAIGAIESVGLGHRIWHEPAQLSGGEKQRAAIARALVNKPAVIFADEPTGNLDSKSGATVMDVLQQLNETARHTIILITHETYTAEYAERIIRIRDGKVESDERVQNRRRSGDGGILK